MKKAIIILAFIVLMFSNYLPAQVPGFEGKKFSLYYYGSFGLRPNANDNDPGYSKDFNGAQSAIGINYRHNIDADYVVSKSVTLGVGFKALRTGTNDFLFPETDYYDANTGSYVTNNNTFGFVNMNTKFFSLFVKKFFSGKSGYIAPVGSYGKFELAFGVTNVIGDSVSVNNGTTTTAKIPFQSLNVPGVKTVAFFYTIGQQQLIAKRIYIDYGFEIGFTTTLIGKALASSTADPTNITDYTNEKNATSTELRLFEHILFNAHVGTGILLF